MDSVSRMPKPEPSTVLVRAGLVGWGVQGLYVLAELAAAAGARAPYSLWNNTISDLGAVSCGVVDYPAGPVPVCSPWHPLMNAAFVVFGVLMAVGAVLLRPVLPTGRAATVSVALWVVAGLSSIGTGLAPEDVAPAWHVALSAPAFLAQPLALVLLGFALRGPRLRWPVLVAATVSIAGAVGFFAVSGGAEFGGLLERAALWPGYLWCTAFAVTVAAARRTGPATVPARA